MLKKIYVTANDIVLPVALEDINLAWQGYPIWIENKPYRPPPLRTEEEDESGWRYHAPQELYRILLSPYEPVLIEDTRQRQLHPFSTYALGHPFNEAALLSLQGIPFQGIYGQLQLKSTFDCRRKLFNYNVNYWILLYSIFRTRFF